MDTTTIDTTKENLSFIPLLHAYANSIKRLLNNSDYDTMNVVKRILHILNIFLRNYKCKEKEKQIYSIITSITYAPPWDIEDVIFDKLDNLCYFLTIYYPNKQDLSNAITEDLHNISILSEIKKILEL